MHGWYWLADICRDHHIPFVLGHAWAMKAVHGQKTKCDRKDADDRDDQLSRNAAPIAAAGRVPEFVSHFRSAAQ
jgi:hypothetical protein